MPRGENAQHGKQGFQKTHPKDLAGTRGVNAGAGVPDGGKPALVDPPSTLAEATAKFDQMVASRNGGSPTVTPRSPHSPMNAEQAGTLLRQIGPWNVAAISGGRKSLNADGVLVLPVGRGYSVEVAYNEGADDYTVRRVFTRAGKRTVKGELEHVYADEVGERAYEASSFQSYDFPKGASD